MTVFEPGRIQSRGQWWRVALIEGDRRSKARSRFIRAVLID